MIPGCPAVGESWYREITPLQREELSTTTSQSPYWKRLSVEESPKVDNQVQRVEREESWWVWTWSSRVMRVVARAKTEGGRTVTLTLLSVPGC